MKKCENCGVKVFENENICPLCHRELEGETKNTIVEYPKYKDLISYKTPLKHLPLFIAVTAIITSIYINFFTHKQGDIIWSILVSGCVLYGFVMFNIVTMQRRYGRKILFTYIATSVVLIIIDFCSGMNLWSTDFVFPFLTIAVIGYLMVLALRSKRLFSEYFGFILAVTGISFTSVIFYFSGLNNRTWGAFVAVISCVLIAFGLYLFSDKTLKEEIRKRFYH